MARIAFGIFALAASVASCSSGVAPAAQSNTYPQPLMNQLAQNPPPDDAESSAAPPPVAQVSSAPPPAPNHEPEMVRRDAPESVIAGRTVAFGLDVIDDDLDPVRVELRAHPDGATLDAHTLTVHWTVPAAMRGVQTFAVHIVENPGAANERSIDRTLSVEVVPRAIVPGHPAVVAPFVATLVTITSHDYLARTAREWPIEHLLETLRDDAIDALPADERAAIQRRTGAELFHDLLTAYAQQHQYAAMDPAGHGFDHRFDSAHWRLVAIRPRVNKAIEELRLVYQVDVAEPVFAMFRVRLFRGPRAPSPEVARANDAAFTRLVHDAYFDGARLKPGIAQGQAQAVSTAVATLVHSVLTFRDPQNAALRTGLAAIPEEARLGGGSVFDDRQQYVRGNAWAFTVANIRVDPAGRNSPRSVHVINGPISAFTFDIAANAGGDAFTSVCPPRYREGGEPGFAAFCQPDGTVSVRERDAGDRWIAARRDSLAEHHDVVAVEMLDRVPLHDPRRRNFEENGMTCVQCHMRNFDEGVLSEAQVRDPRVHDPITPVRDITRIAQQIIPVGVVNRSPWLVQQETFQVCDLGRKLHDQLGVAVDLPCPDGY